MVGKLVRGLGMGLLVLGLLGLGAGLFSIRSHRQQQAAELQAMGAGDMARGFQLSDMWDFENMHGLDKVLVQLGGTLTVAGAACLLLGRLLPAEPAVRKNERKAEKPT
jgi:hypothetical protein